MSDHEHPDPNEHVARLLREHGPVEAPPDLASDVMRQVRADPRHSRAPRVRWRPAVAFAAAAACLIALGVGIAHLGSGTTSSSSSRGSGGGLKAEAAKTPANDNSAAAGTYTVARKSALAILGSQLYSPVDGAPTAKGSALVVRSPRGFRAVASGPLYDQLARKLAHAAAHPEPGPTVVVTLTRRKR